MCIQSYYNYDQNDELKLDLLSEIKNFGIDEWTKKVYEERKKIRLDKMSLEKQ